MVTLKIFISTTHNPHFNLATEDWIFHDFNQAEHILFLWRNHETVVIGRSQNPWVECNLERMTQDKIALARRQSGGGAVFHDLGNTNFTFLSKKNHYRKENNFQIILAALQQFNINAELSGRNDLVVNLANEQGLRKISGSAFKEKQDRAFHHGTLLLHTQLEKLAQYLNPSLKKLQAKGVKSVRTRVMNLNEIVSDINHDAITHALINAFQQFYNSSAETEILNEATLQTIPALQQYYQHLKSWDWLYGQTLEFTHRFEERFTWGVVDIQLIVDNAIVNEVQIYSDSLFPEMIEKLQQRLKGMPYQTDSVTRAVESLKQDFLDLHTELEDLKKWLAFNL